MNIMLNNTAPEQPWTRRDTWMAAAYGVCSALTITAALTIPQLAAQHPQQAKVVAPVVQSTPR
jgi:hypothetical protein